MRHRRLHLLSRTELSTSPVHFRRRRGGPGRWTCHWTSGGSRLSLLVFTLLRWLAGRRSSDVWPNRGESGTHRPGYAYRSDRSSRYLSRESSLLAANLTHTSLLHLLGWCRHLIWVEDLWSLRISAIGDFHRSWHRLSWRWRHGAHRSRWGIRRLWGKCWHTRAHGSHCIIRSWLSRSYWACCIWCRLSRLLLRRWSLVTLVSRVWNGASSVAVTRSTDNCVTLRLLFLRGRWLLLLLLVLFLLLRGSGRHLLRISRPLRLRSRGLLHISPALCL